MRKIFVVPVILALLGCMALLSSCSGQPSGADKAKIAGYLEAVGPDFEQSKTDLEVFDQDIGDDVDSLVQALDLVEKSKADFMSRMESVKKQEVPGSPKEIADFHNALLQYYDDSIKIMDAYDQILGYSVDLYKSIDPLMSLMSNGGGDDVISTVESLKTSIEDSIAIAEECSPPAYMADSHTNYVNALKSFSGATDDFLYALQLTDPLRVNATTYRFELLSNKIGHIGDEMSKEIDAEQTQMTALGDTLEKNQDDLYNQLLIWQDQYKVGS